MFCQHLLEIWQAVELLFVLSIYLPYSQRRANKHWTEMCVNQEGTINVEDWQHTSMYISAWRPGTQIEQPCSVDVLRPYLQDYLLRKRDFRQLLQKHTVEFLRRTRRSENLCLSKDFTQPMTVFMGTKMTSVDVLEIILDFRKVPVYMAVENLQKRLLRNLARKHPWKLLRMFAPLLIPRSMTEFVPESEMPGPRKSFEYNRIRRKGGYLPLDQTDEAVQRHDSRSIGKDRRAQ